MNSFALIYFLWGEHDLNPNSWEGEKGRNGITLNTCISGETADDKETLHGKRGKDQTEMEKEEEGDRR